MASFSVLFKKELLLLVQVILKVGMLDAMESHLKLV